MMAQRNQGIDWGYRLHTNDLLIAEITDEKVSQALDGFPKQPVKSPAWIGTYVRWAFFEAVRLGGQLAERKSNLDMVKELEGFASQARELYTASYSISTDTETALWNYALRSSDLDGHVSPEGYTMEEPYSYKHLAAARAQLHCLAVFVQNAANDIRNHKQPPRWKESAEKQVRIYLGVNLVAVFEEAFECKATHAGFGFGSNYEPEQYGHWPEFYVRMLKAAKYEGATLNLDKVMRESLRLHRKHPALLPPEIAPQ